MHQLVDFMLVEKRLFDQPRAWHDFVDIADSLKHLFAFFEAQFGLIPLFRFYFFVGGECDDDIAQFFSFF